MLGAGLVSVLLQQCQDLCRLVPRPPTSGGVDLQWFLGQDKAERYRCEDGLVGRVPISAPVLVWAASLLAAPESGVERVW